MLEVGVTAVAVVVVVVVVVVVAVAAEGGGGGVVVVVVVVISLGYLFFFFFAGFPLGIFRPIFFSQNLQNILGFFLGGNFLAQPKGKQGHMGPFLGPEFSLAPPQPMFFHGTFLGKIGFFTPRGYFGQKKGPEYPICEKNGFWDLFGQNRLFYSQGIFWAKKRPRIHLFCFGWGWVGLSQWILGFFSSRNFEEVRGISRKFEELPEKIKKCLFFTLFIFTENFEELRGTSRNFEEVRGTSRGRSGEFWRGFFFVWTILCANWRGFFFVWTILCANWPDCLNFARKPPRERTLVPIAPLSLFGGERSRPPKKPKNTKGDSPQTCEQWH